MLERTSVTAFRFVNLECPSLSLITVPIAVRMLRIRRARKINLHGNVSVIRRFACLRPGGAINSPQHHGKSQLSASHSTRTKAIVPIRQRCKSGKPEDHGQGVQCNCQWGHPSLMIRGLDRIASSSGDDWECNQEASHKDGPD